MGTDSFLVVACAGLIGILFGLAVCFAGYRLFLVLLPIWGLFVGFTTGAALPNLRPALQTVPGGFLDGFVSLLTPKGAVQWSALIGGGDVDKVTGLALDGRGVITLAGSRMYTSMADTDEVIDDALERFERVLSRVEGV